MTEPLLHHHERHGWVLRLGEMPAESAAALAELVDLFNRAGRGNFVDALRALAEMRRNRGTLAGFTSLTLEVHEGGGDPALGGGRVNWRETLSISPRQKHIEEAREAAEYKRLAESGKTAIAGKV